jgi:hypothetical protein
VEIREWGGQASVSTFRPMLIYQAIIHPLGAFFSPSKENARGTNCGMSAEVSLLILTR